MYIKLEAIAWTIVTPVTETNTWTHGSDFMDDTTSSTEIDCNDDNDPLVSGDDGAIVTAPSDDVDGIDFPATTVPTAPDATRVFSGDVNAVEDADFAMSRSLTSDEASDDDDGVAEATDDVGDVTIPADFWEGWGVEGRDWSCKEAPAVAAPT